MVLAIDTVTLESDSSIIKDMLLKESGLKNIIMDIKFVTSAVEFVGSDACEKIVAQLLDT